MTREHALNIAERYIKNLSPYCDRIEIAGSLRRGKQVVGDIELVCIPKRILIETDLFQENYVRHPEFVKIVNRYTRVKGNGEGKYTQIIDGDGYVDLFMTTAEQWGLIFMIRTGSANYSKRIVEEIKSRGYKAEDGYLKNMKGEVIPCYEEKDFYEITKTTWIEPEARIF